MDNTLQDLENELKTLQPRAPSEKLKTRLMHELGASTASVRPVSFTAATSFRSWKWAGWQLAAAAAVALTVSLIFWRRVQSGSTAPSLAQTQAQAQTAQTAQTDDQSDSPTAVDAARPRVASHDTYRPVGATNVLYDLKDEGPDVLADNTPARRVRYRYVDTYTWKNPKNNASVKWSVPREEVRVIPASLN